MSLSLGTRLGPYEIQSALGAGGMGEVYKARDTRLDRTVAIKVLPAHLAADPQFRERFDREARAISALNHPHICTLHDIGDQDGVNYLVLEFLNGETLSERLARTGGSKDQPLRVDETLTVAIQIADALDKAHRAGITHRDLKPGNIMLARVRAGGSSDPPIAKLLDFGLAKTTSPLSGVQSPVRVSQLETEDRRPEALTAAGTILGTFQYMAPEQLEGKDADARTDVFAFGAVVYEMLSGKKAFEGKTQASLIGAIMHAKPPPISSVQPLTPASLDRVVTKCLAKDPDERWQSAKDLCDELKWIAAAGARVGETTASPPRRRRAYGGWLAAAVALLLVIVMSVVALRRPASELPLTRLDVVTPPTSDPVSFALSPDGRQLVFVAEGTSTLWLRPLDQTDARPLSGTEGASYPFWAPDSRAIGFFADGKLKRLDLSGGKPQVLADAPAGQGGAWNRDGVILFAPNLIPGSVTGRLVRVNATGGSVTVVTSPAAGEGSHRFPEFLPDGRHFLFYVGFSRLEVQGVYLGSLDMPGVSRLFAADTAAAYAPPGYVLAMRQGVLVAARFDAARGAVAGEPVPVAQAVGSNDFRGAFSVSTNGVLVHRTGAAGRRQLAWINRTGETMGTLGAPDESNLLFPELTFDNRRVAVNRTEQGNTDIWLIEVTRGVASRFTFDPVNDASPMWAPDGSRLIFRSDRNGAFDLFEKPASGARDEQPVLASSDAKRPVDWSPDGRVLLYVNEDLKTSSDLWALPFDPAQGRPLGNGQKPFPVVQTSFREDEGQFAPDGRWVAYRSNESGRDEIYVRPFPGPGGRWQVSAGGGGHPRWRRNGKELFYISPENKLMAVAIDLPSAGQAPEVGAPVPLFTTHLAGLGFPKQPYAVASDGQRFLMVVLANEASAPPITVVQNWTSALRQGK